MAHPDGYLLDNQQAEAGERFDLVHARLVLAHVAGRGQALRSMISVLRPGGWLLVEDADPALQPLICPDESGPAQQLANRPAAGRFRRHGWQWPAKCGQWRLRHAAPAPCNRSVPEARNGQHMTKRQDKTPVARRVSDPAGWALAMDS
jgi:SAM-dependent methyltransferase